MTEPHYIGNHRLPIYQPPPCDTETYEREAIHETRRSPVVPPLIVLAAIAGAVFAAWFAMGPHL